MLYNYRTIDSGITDKQFDARNNTDVSVIYMPNNRHQVQLGYYRKFYNPVYPVLLAEGNTLLNEEWAKADKLLDMERIVSVGNICLSLFLGMAMISLRLWELQSLALPLIVILASQVLLMGLFVYFVAFPMLGRNYDVAVLCAGMCGFGLGATPNAMANMSAVCYKYRYTVKPFLIVPIIGAMFADLINTAIITLFLNLL